MQNEGYIKNVTFPANALDHEQMDYIMKHGVKRITILRRGIEISMKELTPTENQNQHEDNIKK